MELIGFLVVVALHFHRILAQADSTITSAGEHANPNFQFAVGVPSLSFSNINDCSDAGTSACRTVWSSGTSTFVAFISGPSCASNDPSVTCSLAGLVLTSTYTTDETSSASEGSVTVELNTVSSLTSTVTFTLKYCDPALLEATATAANASATCGFQCTTQYSCNEPEYAPNTFTATCREDAAWDRTSPCTKACNNAFFADAVAIEPVVVVGEDGTKNFTCVECPPSLNFSRTCGAGGRWKNEINPCSPACNISEVACSPEKPAPFCPGDHTFSCPSGFCWTDTIECLSTGNWSRTECVCPTGLTTGQILAIVLALIWAIVLVVDVYCLWVRNKQLIEELKKELKNLEREAEEARAAANVANAEADKAEEEARKNPTPDAITKAEDARKKADEANQKAVEAEEKVKEAKKKLECAFLLSTCKVVTQAVVTCFVTIVCLVLLILCLDNKEVAWGIGGALQILNDFALIICIFLTSKGHFDAEGMTPPKSPKNAKVSPQPDFGQSLL